jgi:hypothetical protein
MYSYALDYARALVKNTGLRIGDASFLARNVFELTEVERIEILATLRIAS